MANKVLHGYCATSLCSCMNVDALNRCGVYAEGALDNGVMVTLEKMVQDSAYKATGFEYEVAPATVSSENVWAVVTPEVGTTLEMQDHADPRLFYNEAGRPMSIKKLVPEVDEIEVTKECFTDATLPTNTNKWIAIGEGGKLTASASQPMSKGGYFELVALHSVAIGWEKVPTAIIRYREYKA